MRLLLLLLLPGKFFYADHLTSSARRLIARVAVAGGGVVAASVGLGLLSSDNWPDVLAGALFAWATSVIVWAVNSYRTGTDEVGRELRRMAELDLVHARFNHLARRLDAPLLDLQGEIESVLAAREERLAHFAGLNEFRVPGTQAGTEWWDSDALGFH